MFSVGDRVLVDMTGIAAAVSAFSVSSTAVVMEVIDGSPVRYRIKVLMRPGGWQEHMVDANRVQQHS